VGLIGRLSLFKPAWHWNDERRFRKPTSPLQIFFDGSGAGRERPLPA
jgi:hypothetical protein